MKKEVIKKKCKACLEEKEFCEFYKKKDSPDAFENRCKKCYKSKNKNFVEKVLVLKNCSACNKDKFEHEFGKRNKNNYLNIRCLDCRNRGLDTIVEPIVNIIYTDIKGALCIEEWKDVVGYEGLYKISDFGRIISVGGKGRGGKNKDSILLPYIDKHGYLVFKPSKNSQTKDMKVHLAVAYAFLNHSKGNGHSKVVDHINEIKTDNRLSNLQIISQRENCMKVPRFGKSSIYLGVRKSGNRFRAEIRVKAKKISLGSFIEEYDAHLAYQRAFENIDKYSGDVKKFRSFIKSII